jgi:hypothetical protein
VLKCIRVRFGSQHVALGASYHDVLQVVRNRGARYFTGNAFDCHSLFWGHAGVPAVLPVIDNSGLEGGVAINTLSGRFTDGNFCAYSSTCADKTNKNPNDHGRIFHNALLHKVYRNSFTVVRLSK